MKNLRVKKRDGSIEPFMPEKIVVSAVKSGVPYEVARELVSSVEHHAAKDVIETTTIREHVHKELKSRGLTSAVENWERYDSEMKRKS